MSIIISSIIVLLEKINWRVFIKEIKSSVGTYINKTNQNLQSSLKSAGTYNRYNVKLKNVYLPPTIIKNEIATQYLYHNYINYIRAPHVQRWR